MARGRHRVSAPLHRLLSPLTVAALSVALAAGAWFVPAEQRLLVLRALVGAVALVGCVAALLLRGWDRAAGKRVAELTTARSRDEWRFEERVAELETEAEEAREARQQADAELRAKRAELARLRGEHAELLRRYATAESERARALESRRRLALEASVAPKAIAPPAAGLTPAAYHRAAQALRDLPRNAARQQALRTVEAARRREAAAHADGDGEESQGRHAHPADGAARPAVAAAAEPAVREHRLVPAVAAAVVPYARPARPASRQQGGFDFFGVNKQPAGTDADAEAEVIDLTAHDDTEQLDMLRLRAGS